jgi:hypothetical protein
MCLLTVFAGSSFAGTVTFSAVVSGASITFTDATTATGTIGSTSFTDDSITIWAIADTSAIQSDSQGFFVNNTSASVTISGIGTFSFSSGTRFFVSNTGQEVGFSRAGISGSDLIDGPINPAFSSWNMLTSIGPFTGGGGILQWDLSPVLTSGGTLVLANNAPVAEPSTFLLFGIGLLGLGCFVRGKLDRKSASQMPSL